MCVYVCVSVFPFPVIVTVSMCYSIKLHAYCIVLIDSYKEWEGCSL